MKDLLPVWTALWENIGIWHQGGAHARRLAADFDLNRSHDVGNAVLDSVTVPESVYVEAMTAPVHRLVDPLDSRTVAVTAERVELLSAEDAADLSDAELVKALTAKIDDFLDTLDRLRAERVIGMVCFCPYWPPMLRKDGSWFMRGATHVWERLVWAPGAYVKGVVVEAALDSGAAEKEQHLVTATFVFETTDDEGIKKLEQSLYEKRRVRLEIE